MAEKTTEKVIERTYDITSKTGKEFQDMMIDFVNDSEWKYGKVFKFNVKIGEELTLQVFQIRAVVKHLPIEDIISFRNINGEISSKVSWSDPSVLDMLEEKRFYKYYNNFIANPINTCSTDLINNSIMFKICIMLTFEIARWKSNKENLIKAINFSLAHREEEDENIAQMCKMFPHKSPTKGDEENRLKYMEEILKRIKMQKINDINKKWPKGEKQEDLFEMLSGNEIERRYAFEKFIKRKEEAHKVLLHQDEISLGFFKTILSDDVESSKRAFEQLNLHLSKRK